MVMVNSSFTATVTWFTSVIGLPFIFPSNAMSDVPVVADPLSGKNVQTKRYLSVPLPFAIKRPVNVCVPIDNVFVPIVKSSRELSGFGERGAL